MVVPAQLVRSSEARCISPISPLYLLYISPVSPQVIAWLRVREFQLLSLRMICHQMLRASPHYSALEAGHAPVDLEAESPMSRYDKAKDKVVLPRPLTLPPPPPYPRP